MHANNIYELMNKSAPVSQWETGTWKLEVSKEDRIESQKDISGSPRSSSTCSNESGVHNNKCGIWHLWKNACAQAVVQNVILDRD
jgi:hypothetical protein